MFLNEINCSFSWKNCPKKQNIQFTVLESLLLMLFDK